MNKNHSQMVIFVMCLAQSLPQLKMEYVGSQAQLSVNMSIQWGTYPLLFRKCCSVAEMQIQFKHLTIGIYMVYEILKRTYTRYLKLLLSSSQLIKKSLCQGLTPNKQQQKLVTLFGSFCNDFELFPFYSFKFNHLVRNIQ